MYTTDHSINKFIGRSVVYIWAKLHLFVLLLYATTDYNLQYMITTGSHGTFEFPSRVDLYGPSLYCVARTLD